MRNIFLRYLYYKTTLNIPICFDPQGKIITEPNQINVPLVIEQCRNIQREVIIRVQLSKEKYCAFDWLSVDHCLSTAQGMNNIKIFLIPDIRLPSSCS